jgi:DNA repair exonuclease SbcCD ATPase subunit
MELNELHEPPFEGMSEDELRSFARFLFGKFATMTTTLKQLLASQKASEEEQRRLMSQIESLQKQLQTITEKFSEACQQILEVTRQKDKLAEELTIFKADHFGSSKTRKMKTKTEVAGLNDALPDKHEICKAMNTNFRDYLIIKVITEMNKGRSDYKNLLPMTISLK